SCTTTGRRSTWCRATSSSGTTRRARAASSPSRRRTRAARPACTTGPSLRAPAASSTKFTITKPPGMLKTGNEHLESLRDGRIVYIGSERVDDVTTHPAFRHAARTVAGIYDMKLAQKEAMSFEEGGERYSIYFLMPKTREDLARR